MRILKIIGAVRRAPRAAGRVTRQKRRYSPDGNNMMPCDYGNHPAVFAHRDIVWNTTGYANPYHMMYAYFMIFASFFLVYHNCFTPNEKWNKNGHMWNFWEEISPNQSRDDLDELMRADPYPPHPNLEKLLAQKGIQV